MPARSSRCVMRLSKTQHLERLVETSVVLVLYGIESLVVLFFNGRSRSGALGATQAKQAAKRDRNSTLSLLFPCPFLFQEFSSSIYAGFRT